MRRAAALFLLVLFSAQAATLSQRIEKILSEPGARRAFWGIKVLDLDSGETLYQLNADHFFTPASNTKLFSTALALLRLGPDYRFLTRIATDALPDAEGRIAGELVLAGGGDPNFSARVLPYDKQSEFLPNRLQPIDELAEELAAAGIRQIDGDIIGDDTLYVWQRYPHGWAVDDIANGDGPPVTALVINDNVVSLVIRPGQKAGDPALVRLDPPTPYFEVQNLIQTAPKAARPIRMYREPGSRTVTLQGEIGVEDRGRTELLAIDDPALFAAEALREALVRHSITVLGRAASRHAYAYELQDPGKEARPQRPYALVLASRSSMPLVEDLRLTNKISQNLHAELALRAAARERRGVASIEASLAEMRQFLSEAGIGEHDYFLRDGSGLSRLNLLTPAALVQLLAYMWRSPLRQPWLETLPVAALDGTLRSRFVAIEGAGSVHAKTGTLTHVAALSGYVIPPDSRHLAFSILANNYNGDGASLRAILDRICAQILQR